MNKLILSIVFCLTLCGCVEKETITQHLQVSLVNKTEKKLLYAVETSEKTDTIVSVGLDSIAFSFFS